MTEKAIEILEQAITTVSQRNGMTVPLCRVMNEWEVVFLLGAIAKDAGFRLVRGSDKFPDAVLKVQDGNEWVQIRTELEYRASRFDHDSTRCDLVICWRKDVKSIDDLPIIELYPLFPHLDAERDDLEIDHGKVPVELRDTFRQIEKWLLGKGLESTPTGSRTETNTLTFKIKAPIGKRSLCSLQYYPEKERLQFKWFKNTLKQLDLIDVFVEQYGKVPSVAGRDDIMAETSGEFRLNILPKDKGEIHRILSLFDIVFDTLQGRSGPFPHDPPAGGS